MVLIEALKSNEKDKDLKKVKQNFLFIIRELSLHIKQLKTTKTKFNVFINFNLIHLKMRHWLNL